MAAPECFDHSDVQKIIIDIEKVKSKSDVRKIWVLLSPWRGNLSLMRRFVAHFTIHEIISRAVDVDKSNNRFQTELFHNILVAAVSIPELTQYFVKSEYFWNSLKFYVQNIDPQNKKEMYAVLDVVLDTVRWLARMSHRKHLNLILNSKILKLSIQAFKMVKNKKKIKKFRNYFTGIMLACVDKITHPEPLLVKLREQGLDANLHIEGDTNILKTLLNGNYDGLEEGDAKLSGRYVRKFKSKNPPERECFVCGKKDNGKNKIKWCSACKSISYCSREHQEKDWPRHKKKCRLLQSCQYFF